MMATDKEILKEANKLSKEYTGSVWSLTDVLMARYQNIPAIQS